MVSHGPAKPGSFGSCAFESRPLRHSPVVQSAEAPVSKAGQCGFESHRGYHLLVLRLRIGMHDHASVLYVNLKTTVEMEHTPLPLLFNSNDRSSGQDFFEGR